MSLSIDDSSSSLPTVPPPSLSTSATQLDQNLRSGSSGDEVTALQQKLQNAGFNPGNIDGQFGPNTARAVRNFQSANGLPQTGTAGPLTRAALAQAPAQSATRDNYYKDTFQAAPTQGTAGAAAAAAATSRPVTANPAAAVSPATTAPATGAGTSTSGDPAKLAAINNTRLIPGQAHSCVATSVANLRRAGMTGLPNGTSRDPNNARGAMSQMIGSGQWQSANIPGSTSQTIQSPYGNVQANVLSASAYQTAVRNGQIPNGAVVFSTNHGWDYSGGARGNDMGIVRNGAIFNSNQNRTMNVYSNTRQVVVLTPK